MFSNKPWYESFSSAYKLKESDFILSKKEIRDFLSFYREFIDFSKEDYNYDYIKSNFPLVDFLEFDYENESNMDGYVLEILSLSKCFYVAPLIFSVEDLNCILFEFNPSVIAKLNSSLYDYNRVFGSMVSDYSGYFLVASIDFSYVMIVKNGHYILRFHRKKNIYKDRRMDVSLGKVDMYKYDLEELVLVLCHLAGNRDMINADETRKLLNVEVIWHNDVIDYLDGKLKVAKDI